MLRDTQGTFYSFLRGQAMETSSLVPMRLVDIDNCLEIYRRGYIARLTESLGETFEATWWVLGDEDFFRLCHEFIRSFESNSYDLSDYGIEFPKFIASLEQASEAPFIGDLARFEWAFKEVFHQSNILIDSQHLRNEIAQNSDAQFQLSTSARLFESEHSIYEIWKLRREKIEDLTEISFSKSEKIVIYKKQSQVFVKHLSVNEFLVVSSLANGLTITQSIEQLSLKAEISPLAVQDLFSAIGGLGVLEIKPTSKG
ncbi:MAG: putative DNA-binding domain-containing protein [Bdellovibrionales bacterium]